MLEHLSLTPVNYSVYRLSAVNHDGVQLLLSRGINPKDIAEITRNLRSLNMVFEPAQLIEVVFAPKSGYANPYNPSRFTYGQKAVFYSAKDQTTSIEEVKFHQTKSGEFANPKKGQNDKPRYFSIFEVKFSGKLFNIFPLRAGNPELTSQNESGYPKCQAIAEEARSKSADALETPSARHSGGICIPVFSRSSLVTEPKIIVFGRFIKKGRKILFE
ncbi:MAG: RES family NAD+ phosphorylase [Hyphomicrobiales bacterium]|nr:RES family NAD+ phosphorylase [Hyphomicrobiales bacterium]